MNNSIEKHVAFFANWRDLLQQKRDLYCKIVNCDYLVTTVLEHNIIALNYEKINKELISIKFDDDFLFKKWIPFCNNNKPIEDFLRNIDASVLDPPFDQEKIKNVLENCQKLIDEIEEYKTKLQPIDSSFVDYLQNNQIVQLHINTKNLILDYIFSGAYQNIKSELC